MKNQELYNKTVGILAKAFIDDTLQHMNCCACAIGNLVAANCGFKMKENRRWKDNMPYWSDVFFTTTGITTKKQKMLIEHYHDEAKRQIDSTGYTVEEAAKIEYAFETAPEGNSSDEYMFNGLMAVIDVLDQIHENTDNRVTTDSRNKFIKTKHL